MEIEPLETIMAELESNNWLEASHAIHKLVPHGEAATSALHPLFELTLHDKAPPRSYSKALIERLGKHAVPFLRDRATDECPRRREMALYLLMNMGNHRASSTRLVDQVLDSRREELPDWGTGPDE